MVHLQAFLGEMAENFLAVDELRCDDALTLYIDAVDGRQIELGRLENPPRRADHVPRLDLAAQHLRDQAVKGMKVVLIDDRETNQSLLDRPPQRLAE